MFRQVSPGHDAECYAAGLADALSREGSQIAPDTPL
jgi:hypothetical protein